jgi:hypothetical protein
MLDHGPPRKLGASFAVDARDGNNFRARLLPSSQYEIWEIRGTIRDGEIGWLASDVSIVKGSRKRGYDNTGNILNEEISLHHSGETSDDQKRYSSTIKLHLLRSFSR